MDKRKELNVIRVEVEQEGNPYNYRLFIDEVEIIGITALDMRFVPNELMEVTVKFYAKIETPK